MQRDSVESALARIGEAGPFALALRMRRFLRFAVEPPLVRADPVFLPLHGMPAVESLLARIFHQGE
ncbi:MAG TPA: hypothetical protein VGK29_16870 [Paludibaculum sp.]|jgi:hypothetical protein